MISCPVLVSVLEGENAIATNRELMGATDPAKATAGIIHKDLGENIERNAATAPTHRTRPSSKL